MEASTMKSRRGFAIQRLMNAMRQAHADGWFLVVDTLTLADDRLEAFYDNPNALRDYCRDIGRMVLAAEGSKANDSFFFSSRRRHTRSYGDWSSDVCSSDLPREEIGPCWPALIRARPYWRVRQDQGTLREHLRAGRYPGQEGPAAEEHRRRTQSQ